MSLPQQAQMSIQVIVHFSHIRYIIWVKMFLHSYRLISSINQRDSYKSQALRDTLIIILLFKLQTS